MYWKFGTRKYLKVRKNYFECLRQRGKKAWVFIFLIIQEIHHRLIIFQVSRASVKNRKLQLIGLGTA